MMKRKNRKEQITRERREQILDAAHKVFIRKGFAKATTAEIARTAGIAEGTIYNYFGSKRELFTELLKNFILSAPLMEIIGQPLQLDSEMLTSIIGDRVNMFFDNAELFILLLSELQRDEELHRQFIEKVTSPGIDMLNSFLTSMMKEGVVRPFKTELISRILPAIMIGLTILRVVEGEKGPLNSMSRKEIVNELVSFNTRAIFSEGISLE
jgi:AcrR family transcriptional regulator